MTNLFTAFYPSSRYILTVELWLLLLEALVVSENTRKLRFYKSFKTVNFSLHYGMVILHQITSLFENVASFHLLFI